MSEYKDEVLVFGNKTTPRIFSRTIGGFAYRSEPSANTGCITISIVVLLPESISRAASSPALYRRIFLPLSSFLLTPLCERSFDFEDCCGTGADRRRFFAGAVIVMILSTQLGNSRTTFRVIWKAFRPR